MKTILEDEREVVGVHYNNDEGGGYTVGVYGCTKISAYGEPGEYCNKPWIAVWFGEEIRYRIPAGAVEIAYAAKEE